MPPDLQPYIKSADAREALRCMVSGSNMHVDVSIVETGFAMSGYGKSEGPHPVDESTGSVRVDEDGHRPPRASVAAGGGHGSVYEDGDRRGVVNTRGEGGERALLANMCYRAVLCLEGLVAFTLVAFTRRARNLRTRKKLRRQRAVSGDRYVQMSMDLSTLRWSWNDYILIHEIIGSPTDGSGHRQCLKPCASAAGRRPLTRLDSTRLTMTTSQGLLCSAEVDPVTNAVTRMIVVHYTSPEGSHMQLKLTFTTRELYSTWLLGLQALHEVNLFDAPEKVA